MNNLACLLASGSSDGSVPPDVEAAEKLLRAAAQAGSDSAWLNLGMCYEDDRLLPSEQHAADLETSNAQQLQPNELAAEQCYTRSGTPAALLRLGMLQLKGGRTSIAQRTLEVLVEME